MLFVVRGGRKGEDIIFVVLLSPFSEEEEEEEEEEEGVRGVSLVGGKKYCVRQA